MRAWMHRTQNEIDGLLVFDFSSAGPIGIAHRLAPSPGPLAFSDTQKRNQKIVKSGLLLLQATIPNDQCLCVSDYDVRPTSLLPVLDLSSAHLLQRVGYADLRQEEAAIFDSLDKGAQKRIRKSQREFSGELRVFDSASPGPQLENEIRKAEALHGQIAGRRTRPSSSWTAMTDMLVAGRAILITASLNGGFDSYLLAMTDGVYSAVGASQASKLDAKKISIRNRLEWEMISALKSRGYGSYEVGRIFSKSHPLQTIDEKLTGIGRYKRGMSPLVGARLTTWLTASALSSDALWLARSGADLI